MSRFAVLDLGTNTFHILIVENNGGAFTTIYQERIYTKLGEEGIDRIGEIPYQRGMDALAHFSKVLEEHEVINVKALGTAGLRQASNGQAFIQEAATNHNINIEVIDGLSEAEYIYKGVRQAIPRQASPYLIMDIGGGSVEFIIADSHDLVYKDSFKIGLSPLHAVADISDVAAVDDVVELHRWLASQLPRLYTAIRQYQPKALIGSAGAFEVLVTMSGLQLENENYFEIEKEKISALYVEVLGSSKKDKRSMTGLPKERVDYISAALVLIWHIIDTVEPDQILVSKYALKEGALSTFLD